jgi:hypothetical protein
MTVCVIELVSKSKAYLHYNKDNVLVGIGFRTKATYNTTVVSRTLYKSGLEDFEGVQ